MRLASITTALAVAAVLAASGLGSSLTWAQDEPDASHGGGHGGHPPGTHGSANVERARPQPGLTGQSNRAFSQHRQRQERREAMAAYLQNHPDHAQLLEQRHDLQLAYAPGAERQAARQGFRGEQQAARQAFRGQQQADRQAFRGQQQAARQAFRGDQHARPGGFQGGGGLSRGQQHQAMNPGGPGPGGGGGGGHHGPQH
jgi:hypothetical protein